MDFESLYDASFEKQSYWVHAKKAAKRAGRRTASLLTNRGASHRRSKESCAAEGFKASDPQL